MLNLARPFDSAADAQEIADLYESARCDIDAMRYPHLCDVWAPVPIVLDPTSRAVTNASQTFQIVIQNQACYHEPTPELDGPSDFGRTKDIGIFTLDKFFFPTGTDIADGYALVFLSRGDNYLGVWKVQGNPESTNQDAFHPLSRRMVYGVREGSIPKGVTNPVKYGFKVT